MPGIAETEVTYEECECGERPSGGLSSRAEFRRLKILVVGLNYAPDYIGIPKYTTELCEDLAQRGHDVRVVTAHPYYPSWKVADGYTARSWRTEQINRVLVHRVPFYVPAAPSGISRVLHLASFAVTSFLRSVQVALTWRPNLVFSVAPALVSATGALAAAKLSGAASWLHVQDFEVDAAFEFGLLNGDRARRFALFLERWFLKSFHRVSTISPRMLDQLRTKGVRRERAVEFRNWVDIGHIVPLPNSQTSYRKELGISPTAKIALYSGNMAAKQGLHHLTRVSTRLLELAPEVVVLLCGNGPARDQLYRQCHTLGNVRFLDLQPVERLSELLGTADIHLLPQRKEVSDLVLPSKLAGILASGRPAVVMAWPNTSLAAEVAGAGVIVEPGNPEAMAEAVADLAQNDALRAEMGMAGRRLAEERWNRSAVVDGFENHIQRLTSTAP